MKPVTAAVKKSPFLEPHTGEMDPEDPEPEPLPDPPEPEPLPEPPLHGTLPDPPELEPLPEEPEPLPEEPEPLPEPDPLPEPLASQQGFKLKQYSVKTGLWVQSGAYMP